MNELTIEIKCMKYHAYPYIGNFAPNRYFSKDNEIFLERIYLQDGTKMKLVYIK